MDQDHPPTLGYRPRRSQTPRVAAWARHLIAATVMASMYFGGGVGLGAYSMSFPRNAEPLALHVLGSAWEMPAGLFIGRGRNTRPFAAAAAIVLNAAAWGAAGAVASWLVERRRDGQRACEEDQSMREVSR